VTDTADPRRRWDTDDRFTGVADARDFAAAADELVKLTRLPGWVAEDPEVHMVPHLRNPATAELRLLEVSTGDRGLLNVTAEAMPGASRRDIRKQAWALIGTVAETLASVREHARGDQVVFDVVTGVSEAGQFATHGHTLRLIVYPPRTATGSRDQDDSREPV
jgi:hypothetical protein